MTETKHTPTPGLEPDAVDLIDALLEKFDRYPPEVPRLFSREQARSIISGALAGYGSRSEGTSGAYAFLGIMDAIGIKGWTYQPGHEPELSRLRNSHTALVAALERADAKIDEALHQLAINVEIAERDHPEGPVVDGKRLPSAMPHSQAMLASHVRDRLHEAKASLAALSAEGEKDAPKDDQSST